MVVSTEVFSKQEAVRVEGIFSSGVLGSKIALEWQLSKMYIYPLSARRL